MARGPRDGRMWVCVFCPDSSEYRRGSGTSIELESLRSDGDSRVGVPVERSSREVLREGRVDLVMFMACKHNLSWAVIRHGPAGL